MAGFTSRRCCVNMAGAMVVYVLLVVAVRASGRHANDWRCPIADTAVFPYRSFCSNPAVYGYGGQTYELVEPVSGLALAPEWDYSNSPPHMRLDIYGAEYEIFPQSFTHDDYVTVNVPLSFRNPATGRVLAWHNEGGDTDVLVEEKPYVIRGAIYELVPNHDVDLPCPPALECVEYSILEFNLTFGLSPFEEEDVTYFKKSATNLSSFVLVDPFSTLLRRNRISQIV